MAVAAAISPNELQELLPTVPRLLGDLRSDHAGETGAVMIYRGILAGSAAPELRRFAARHMATEENHLAQIEALVPPTQRSILLPVWRIAGWLTGYLPALVSARAVYATIEAVETFVDQHYEHQVQKLALDGPGGALRAALRACQADEIHHRDEARAAQPLPAGPMLRAWVWLVGLGSRAAVVAARRI